MAETTEQAVKDALRAHHGGIGVSLEENYKQEITNGRSNEAENKTRVDGDKFLRCAVASLKRHPANLILK